VELDNSSGTLVPDCLLIDTRLPENYHVLRALIHHLNQEKPIGANNKEKGFSDER
jgi:hypothetical protein